MVRRYDRYTIDAPVRTDEGYLIARANITRTGVFEYSNADGTTRRELRLAEDVFDPASLASFNLKPLTLGHPRESITAKNVRRYQRGIVSQPTKADDGLHVSATITVLDADAIDAIDKGTSQLSNGYDTDNVPIPGGVHTYPNGDTVRADYYQRNIRGNHTAIVPVGRAGSTSCIRLDSAGDETPEDEEPTMAMTADEKAKLDAAEKLAAEQKSRADKAEGELAEARKRADTAQAAADLNTKALEGLKGRLDAADAEKAQAARGELLGKAVALLGATRRDELSKLDTAALRLEIAKGSGLPLDGKSPEYISAVADAQLARKRDSAEDIGSLALRARSAPGSASEDDELTKRIDAARTKAVEHLENAWKIPAPA